MPARWLIISMLWIGLSAALPGNARAAQTERPVSGLVASVQPHAGTVFLGSDKFYVSKDVYDLSGLSEGTQVVITFERSGGRRVATELRVEADPR